MKSFSRACFAFLALLAVGSAAPPNIIFIMTDQQSADALSCRMGDRYLKTPALDCLAARGTFFTRPYAAKAVSFLTQKHERPSLLFP